MQKKINIFHRIEREAWEPKTEQPPESACRCACAGCCCGGIMTEMPRAEGDDHGTEAAKT